MNVNCPLCNNKAQLKNTVLLFQYYLCHKCETLFLYPFPFQKKIEAYYQKNFVYSSGEINEKVIRNRAQHILKCLLALKPQGSELLDIGSGYGYFLEEANKKGLNSLGIEPSISLTKKSKNKVNVISGKFPTDKLQKKQFDFITLIHVVEHLKNPFDVIKEALKLLKANGILYVETPNLRSHLYFAEKDQYTFLTPPDHLWIFSISSFKKCLPDSCLLFKTSTYSYPEHLMGIIKKVITKKKQNKECGKQIQIQPQTTVNNFSRKLTKSLKYIFFDQFVARLFYRLLNINQYGSILELYIKKN